MRDENVSATIKIDPDLLGKADDRAKELDLNRSQYLRKLIRDDLKKLGLEQPVNQAA